MLVSQDNWCDAGDVILYNFICLIVVPVFIGDNPYLFGFYINKHDLIRFDLI